MKALSPAIIACAGGKGSARVAGGKIKVNGAGRSSNAPRVKHRERVWQMIPLRRLFLGAIISFGSAPFLALLPGCSASMDRHAFPVGLRDQAGVPGMPAGIRAWGDQFDPEFERSIVESFRQAQAAYGTSPPSDILAFFGGGSGGAFGAGLLCGWTAAGNRPTFRVVTGVSTGAIIAPFAFLGAASSSSKEVIRTRCSARSRFVAFAISSSWRR